jgi:DNA-directed RNA polymerase I subunit RPA43
VNGTFALAQTTIMSALVNGASSPQAVADISSTPKAKKRKHEGKEGRDSSKKRKHEAEASRDAVEIAPEDQSEASSRKKEQKEKKKSKKDKDAMGEEADVSGHKADAPEGEDMRPDSESRPVNSAEPEARPATKSTKKKKSKSKDVEGSTIEETSALAAEGTETVDIDNDIELPDAPPEQQTTSALPSAANTMIADLLSSSEPSSFHSTRISLLLSIPAVAISQQHALSSILATHLSPLLLTYFPPAKGIVLAFSNPTLSAEAAHALNAPLRPPPSSAVGSTGAPTSSHTLALASDEFGACWAWLTVTLLVFRPSPGDELTGWTNVVSEGFVGVVGYNYFQAAIGKARIPEGWRWVGATGETAGQQQSRKKGRKGRLEEGWHSSSSQNQGQGQGHEEEDATTSGPVFGHRSGDEAGYFVDENGKRVPEVLTFRVVDTEMVPAHEAGGLSLQIDATLLDKQAEEALVREERQKFEKLQQQGKGGVEGGDAVMSGGLARSRQGSIVSAAPAGS